MTSTRPRTPTRGHGSYREIIGDLRHAQKPAGRGAPAYSRFVNRKIGRVFAAWAIRSGRTPNQVTAISAAFTFAGIAMLVIFPPTAWLGIAVGVCLVVGYAFDSADGQVARYTATGSPAGEWLDHMVDATKVSALPLALAVGWYRFEVVDVPWLSVFLVSAVVGAVLFFGMILTEQLRRAHGKESIASTGTAGTVRAVLVLPTDYGVLCLAFFVLGAPVVFLDISPSLQPSGTGRFRPSNPLWSLSAGVCHEVAHERGHLGVVALNRKSRRCVVPPRVGQRVGVVRRGCQFLDSVGEACSVAGFA